MGELYLFYKKQSIRIVPTVISVGYDVGLALLHSDGVVFLPDLAAVLYTVGCPVCSYLQC